MKRVVLQNMEARQQAQAQAQFQAQAQAQFQAQAQAQFQAQAQAQLQAQAQIQRQKRRQKKRFLLTVVLLFLFLASSISALADYLVNHTYQTDLSLAKTGTQHLRSAMSLLESLQSKGFAPQIVERAQQEFASALSDTQSLHEGLANFPGVASLTPVYGQRLTAAIHLSVMAVDVSQAGIGGCNILEMLLTRLSEPLKASTSRLTSLDFTAISNEYQMVKISLNAAMNEAMLVQPGDVMFDAHLAKLLQEFKANFLTIHTALGKMDQLLPALSSMLGIGTPSHYLLEILDSTELRPGGGFIGNYGIATLSGGRLASARITDVDLLDRPFESAGHTIPYPSAYNWFAHYLAPSSWSLRDSNLDADFPTAARYGELNFAKEGGNIPFQGVIAITPSFIEQVLSITGPISVPEYHEVINAQNLVARIHYHQLGSAGEGPDYIASSDGHSSLRKRFTELLGEQLFARVQRLSPSSTAKLLRLAVSSLQTKDIQLYFNASSAENALHLLHDDGTIQSPSGDHLFIVDANVASNKANSFIVNNVHDNVTIDEHGNVDHHTSITYAWTLAGQNYGNNVYKDYLRVYAPPGSILSKQSGWQPLGADTAFGTRNWTGFFTLVYGQTRTIALMWTSNGVAKKEANGWHYQYLLQRQAGIRRTLVLQIALPSCASVTNKWGGLLSKSKLAETSTLTLTHDLNVGVDFTCK